MSLKDLFLRSTSMKVSEIAEQFIRDQEKINARPKTIVSHKFFIDKVIVPVIGHLNIEEMRLSATSVVIERARNHRKTGPKLAAMTLRQIMKFAVMNDYPMRFNWRDIQVPSVPPKEVVVLDPEDIELVRQELSFKSRSFWQKNREFSDLRTRALFELILHNGMRRMECCNANIEDFDPLKQEIKVVNVKTDEQTTMSTVGATKWLQEYLGKRIDNNPAFFVTCSDFGRGVKAERMREMAAKSIARDLRKRLQKRGMKKHFHWHMVRKTYIDILVSNIDIKSAQCNARHKDERTTLRFYAAIHKKKARALSDALMCNI